MKKFVFDFFRFYPVTGNIRETFKLMRSSEGHKETRVKIFGKTEIKLRGKSTDLSVLESTFIHKHHRSPFYLGASPVIVDLGSNIGVQRVGEHPASRAAELTPRRWKTLYADQPLRSDIHQFPV